MISAEVGPPSSMVAAWITYRAGMSPAVVSTASPRPMGAFSSDSRCTSLAAGPADRRGHAAAVREVGVRRVGDGVDLELGHVGVQDLELHDGVQSFLRSVSREGCTRLGSPGIFG